MLDSWPRDKLVAVALLIAAMTPDSKVAIAAIKREDLHPDHSGMADFICLHVGLWDGNAALIERRFPPSGKWLKTGTLWWS